MEDISFWIWTAAAFIAIGFLICRLAYVAFGPAFDYVWEQQALRKLLRRSRKIDEFIARTTGAPEKPPKPPTTPPRLL